MDVPSDTGRGASSRGPGTSADDDVSAGHGRRQFLLGALLLPALAACSSPSSPDASSGREPSGEMAGRVRPVGSRDGGSFNGGTSARGASVVRSQPPTGVLNIVAHPDDDLLFLSPALVQSLRSGAPVRTVFLTAGDDGRAAAYWQEREAGIRAAYSLMAGVPNIWHDTPSGLAERSALTLAGAAQVGVVFLRLPDGGPGHGFPRFGGQSLPQLWRGTEARITAVDDGAQYSRGSLIDALLAVMQFSNPKVVRTQDFHGRFGDGDHGDHHSAAYLTRAAFERFSGPHQLESYQDYGTAGRPVNLAGPLLRAKQAAFAVYSAHDPLACNRRHARCATSFRSWQLRQYRLS